MRQLGYSSPAAINTPVFQMCTHSLWASLAAANLEVYNCQNLKRYNHPDKKGVSGFHGNAEAGMPKNGQRSSGYTKKDNQFRTASVGCLSNSMESSIREGIITHGLAAFSGHTGSEGAGASLSRGSGNTRCLLGAEKALHRPLTRRGAVPVAATPPGPTWPGFLGYPGSRKPETSVWVLRCGFVLESSPRDVVKS
ncbi:hypothetical protein R6Z07F_011843 [Ovis aries]